MYLLLNKNRIIAKFTVENILGFEDIKILNQDTSYKCLLINDIKSFIINRRAPKHRQHISKLLKLCGCDTLMGFLEVSHALSLNDTFWVKNENSDLSWKDVSLYTNPFNTTIDRIAFDGGMFGRQSSSISPEFTTNGTFAKCWVRENGSIKLIKCGSEGFSNCGLEPYSEYYASQILDAFGVNHINYDLSMRHGKLVSKCNLFTSEDIGLIPFHYMGFTSFVDIVNWYRRHGALDKLAYMIIADALILNQDRHLGNFGSLFDTNTGSLIGIAPLYDHNISLLCYATDNEISTNAKLNEYIARVNLGPKLYGDFISVAKQLITPSIRKRLINLQGIKLTKHPKYNLSDRRLNNLNRIVNNQIKLLLQ